MIVFETKGNKKPCKSIIYRVYINVLPLISGERGTIQKLVFLVFQGLKSYFKLYVHQICPFLTKVWVFLVIAVSLTLNNTKPYN
tara:strand:+ start:2687 stop:2938 length:252 start_codon:yes stop_codon:yes gene_type:complete